VDEVNRIQQISDSHGFTNDLHEKIIELSSFFPKQHFIHGDYNTTYFHREETINVASK
jgi:hypothetical protein